METRKITIISTKNQSKKVIMSSATTLAELKEDLRQHDIDFTDMTFFEGTSKVELKTDNSVLPHDVPWKGTTTNELVFMLTNTNKKIASGADRSAVYSTIKSMGLAGICKDTYGKNFTQCTTAQLEELINKYDAIKEVSLKPVENSNEVVDINARMALAKVVNILGEQLYLTENERESILSYINVEEELPEYAESNSSYTDDEINAMFSEMI